MEKTSTHTGVITVKYIVLPICIFLVLAGSVFASDPAEDFKNLLVEETEYFTLQDAEFDEENMFLKAEYLYKPLEEAVTLYLEYGSHVKIGDVSSTLINIGKIAQAWDSGDLSVQEFRMHFNELVDNTEIYKWQKNHGTLFDDYPYLNAFPLEIDNVSFQSYSQRHSNKIRALYDLKGSDLPINLDILYGEAARQAGNSLHCGDAEFVEIDGYGFYENQGFNSFILSYFDDNVLVRVRGTNRDDISNFVAKLNIEALINQTYPKIEGPGDGLSFVKLEISDFESMFPQQMENMTLQGIESYDNAMHIRADYLYEPKDHIIGVHLAFGDYTDRLQENTVSPRFPGNFHLNLEGGCLREKISQDDFNNLRQIIESAESDLARWELENIDYARVNSLAAFFPVEFNGYSIESFYPNKEDLVEVNGEYRHIDDDRSIFISARYGDNAARLYHRYQFQLFGDQAEKYVFNAGGRKFFGFEIRDQFFAHNFTDNLLIEVRTKNPDNLEDPKELASKIGDFINAFNIEPFYDWEEPEGFTMTFGNTTDDGTPICLDTECMEEKLTSCEPGVFGGTMGFRLGVEYEIVEPKGDQCRMSMEYLINPNDEWVDQPLYFSIDRDANFTGSVQEIVPDCMEGRTDAHNCDGPLLELIE